jgi:hypothetical protein
MGRTTCTEPQCLYKGDFYLFLLSLLNLLAPEFYIEILAHLYVKCE